MYGPPGVGAISTAYPVRNPGTTNYAAPRHRLANFDYMYSPPGGSPISTAYPGRNPGKPNYAAPRHSTRNPDSMGIATERQSHINRLPLPESGQPELHRAPA